MDALERKQWKALRRLMRVFADSGFYQAVKGRHPLSFNRSDLIGDYPDIAVRENLNWRKRKKMRDFFKYNARDVNWYDRKWNLHNYSSK